MDVHLFVKEDGSCPFKRWFDGLRDATVRGRIYARINRLRLGNFGDAKSIGGGLWELRFAFGPGYRVYFGRTNGEIVILLCAGDKSSQAKDITLARTYWQLFKEQHNGRTDT